MVFPIRLILIRSGLILLLGFIVWQVIFRLPITQAENSLRQGVEIFSSTQEFPELQSWLSTTTWSDVKIRDRGQIATYHDLGVKALDASKKRLDLTNTNLSKVSFPTTEPVFYKKVNEEIQSSNDIILRNKDYYQKLVDYFNYYEVSTKALFNLMYYDPSLVIGFYEKSPDPDALIQSFGRDADGLKDTKDRILKLPNYQNDNLKTLALLLDPIITKAKLVSDTAGHDAKAALSLAKELDQEVRTVQARFLQNRQVFWQGLHPEQYLVSFTLLRSQNINEKLRLGSALIELKQRH